jgi:hypothetical protein
MSWRERLGPSIAARMAARRDEREFAERVDRAFEADPAAIGRVRAQLLGQDQVPARPVSMPRRAAPGLLRRGLPVAAAFAVIVAAGFLAFNGPGGLSPTGSPSNQAALLTVDLARSATRLHDATTAMGTGDAATIESALTAYRAGLRDLEADLQRPGADLVEAGTDLQTQSIELSAMASLMPVEQVALYSDVRVELDRLIASLPGTDHPGNTDHPTPSDHPGNTDHPTPSDHPGNTDHPTPSDHPGNTDHPTPSDHPGQTDHPTPSNHPGNTDHPGPGDHPTPHPKGSGNGNGKTR